MNIKTLILAFIVIASFSNFSKTNNQHVGWWQGVIEGESAIMHFRSDSYIDIVMDGDTTFGNDMNAGDAGGRLTYIIDYDSNPKQISFIIELQENGVIESADTMKGIFKFKGPKLMICFNNGNNDPRPKSFYKESTVIFTKINN